MIIDEFGCDKIEREESPQSAHLLYKIIASRNQKSSTALATNVDFEKWEEYLPDGPVAMAFLDRIVEGAIILRFKVGRIVHTAPKKQNPQLRKKICGHTQDRIPQLATTERNHPTGPQFNAKVDQFFAAADS